jgi:hypothetical protein
MKTSTSDAAQAICFWFSKGDFEKLKIRTASEAVGSMNWWLSQ